MFQGFSDDQLSEAPLPPAFFTELLPQFDDLAEMKLVIYSLWRLYYSEAVFKYLRLEDILADQRFSSGMGKTPAEAKKNVGCGLARAVERRVLLCAEMTVNRRKECYYFLNTPKGKAAVEAIQSGKWRITENPQLPPELLVEKPNIFELYEQNIGPLTPIIADALKDAEMDFPAQWVQDAFRIAVEKNKRNWRYILAILKRWKQEGRDDRKDRRDSEEARRRYAEWENPH